MSLPKESKEKNKRREPAYISIYFTGRRQGTAFQYYRMIKLRYTLYCRRCPNLSVILALRKKKKQLRISVTACKLIEKSEQFTEISCVRIRYLYFVKMNYDTSYLRQNIRALGLIFDATRGGINHNKTLSRQILYIFGLIRSKFSVNLLCFYSQISND